MTSMDANRTVKTCWACDAVVFTEERVHQWITNGNGEQERICVDVITRVKIVEIENKKCPSQPGYAWVCPHCQAWNHEA